jgi:hypothetical protein
MAQALSVHGQLTTQPELHGLEWSLQTSVGYVGYSLRLVHFTIASTGSARYSHAQDNGYDEIRDYL